MSQSDDDPYDYELLELGESSGSMSDVVLVPNATYHLWDIISERTYPNVTVRECSARADDVAERYYDDNPSHFAHDVSTLAAMYGAHSVNFKVTAVDYENGTQFDVMLRIDVDEGFDQLDKHVEQQTAPAYRGEYGSDNVSGLHIIWKLGWVQFITQTDTGNNVTVVVGDTTMFRGYVTKVVNPLDHNINYSTSDCVYMCLNEATGLRHDPSSVRGELFVDRDALAPVDIKMDIAKIAKYYGCSVAIHDLDNDTKYITSKDKSLVLVRLVRMGLAIGIIDRVVKVLEDASSGDSDMVLNAYYDLETVSDSTSTQAYAFSLIWCDGTKVTLLHHDTTVLNASIRQCLKELMDALPSSSRTIHMHAWNGARFDHPLLMRICNEKFKISTTVMNQQRELLSASIHCGGRTLVLRDPCKMMPMSLTDACAMFGVEQGKLDIDHNAIESAYLLGKLSDYIAQHGDEIKAYVTRDVEVLRLVTRGIIETYQQSNIEYHKHLTRSMASYTSWSRTLSNSTKENLASVQFNYNDVLDFGDELITIEHIKEEAIAGRVQAIPGEYRHVTLLDFKSMYPSVSVQNQYPCGNYQSTKEYVPNKLGLYVVDVLEQSHPHVVPYRHTKHATYDWNRRECITKILTSVDVQCLVECRAKFKVCCGIVWESSTNYFSDHMSRIYELRKEAEIKGNITLAEHYKAMNNSLTGALFQAFRREYTKVFASKDDADIYMKMHNKYILMSYEIVYDNGQIVMFFTPRKLSDPIELKVQREICKGAMGSRPIILTMFIYAYARAKLWRMWRHIEDRHKDKGIGPNSIGTVVYCDTDSLAVVPIRVEGKGYINPMIKLKQYIGNAMGQLEVVMFDSSMIVVSPKVYAMKDKAGVERVRVRSVSKKDVLYLLSDDLEWMAKSAKSMGWLHVRSLYNSPLNNLRISLCYNMVRALLNGHVVLATHWYYARVKGNVEKRYNVMVLKDKGF